MRNDELTDNDEAYHSLFNNIRSGVAYCRMLFEDGRPVDFVYLMVNDAFTEQTGFRDVVGKKVTEVIPGLRPGDPEEFGRYAQVALTGRPDAFEIHSESLQKWFLVSLHSPRPEHFIAVLDNITERKEVQAGLEEKELLLRQFIERAPAAIAMFDGEMRYLAVSGRYMDDYRLPDASLIGRSHYEVFPEITEHWREIHSRGLAGETIRCEEDPFLRRDGRTDWLRWEITPWFSGREVGGILLFTESITERKEVEEQKARLADHLRLALAAAGMGWWSYDRAARKLAYDERYRQIFGLGGEEVDGEHALARVHPDDRAKLLEKAEAAMNPSDPRPFEVQLRIVLDDGSVRWIQSHGIVEFQGKGDARGATRMIGTAADITASKRTEEALRLAATVYRDSSEAMMVLDENRHIIMVNQAFTDITGYENGEVAGRLPGFLRAGRHDDAFYEDMWGQVHRTGRFKGETWHRKKSGEFYAVQIAINTITGDGSLPQRYVVLLSDVTEKKRSDDVIWSQANFDTLTGLPNRRFFRDRLEHEVRNARRSKLPLALLFIDLDGFKDVNDTLGHDMGDLLLQEAADRLYRCVRESDTVARIGGDEFTVILPELHDPGNADRVARHILHALSEPITLGQELAYVSASVGITLYPNDAAAAEELIRNADQAMYEAKQRGKNQYQYFTPSMQKAAIQRMRLVNDMRKALERNQFEIRYQPIVELSTGLVRKAEALIRWRHPRRGLINPVEFISTAEDTGMIASFGNWVFHEAAEQAAVWREKFHHDFQVSVNISPVQFRKEGIDPVLWLEHLKGLDLPGQGIVVEITEGLLMDASPKVTEQLLMLRDAGIEVALDDFGTGYSSLAYLKRFDIDYLKIDQAFVQNLTTNSDDMALCEAMIVMAHKLGLKVIAEGIETDVQRALLTSAGCDFAQGYLFSKPVPAGEFERLVEAAPY